MSISRPIEVECPDCGYQQSVVIWESLNANVSPRAREELIEGKINAFVCESCGQQVQVGAWLLYHDMKRRFAVKYVPFQATEDDDLLRRFDRDGVDRKTAAEEMPTDLLSRFNLDMDYLFQAHIVLDMEELVRYVLFRERVFDVERGVEPAE
jgi:CpXC protein